MSFFYKPYQFRQRSLQNINFCAAQAKKLLHNNLYKSNFLKIFNIVLKLIRKVFCKKRAFRFASCPGLMTVEAAIVVPLFLIAMLTLLNIAHMMGDYQKLLLASSNAIHQACVQGYRDSFGTGDVLSGLVLHTMSSDTDFSEIVGGMAGINYGRTYYDAHSGEITTGISFGLTPRFRLMDIGKTKMNITLHSRALIGGKMLSEESGENREQLQTVYVAENGVVYHKSRECAYIDLSIHAISTHMTESFRNSQGGKYYPCEYCGQHTASVVYITDTGSRWHTSSQCSGLKRSIYEMTLSRDFALPPCSRCSN